MTFSARSLGSEASSSARARSSSSQRPRGRVPFIGRARSRPSLREKNSSGEADRIACEPMSMRGAVTGALGRTDIVVKSEQISGDRGAKAGGEVDLVGIAGDDAAVDLLHRSGVGCPLHRRLPGAGSTGACRVGGGQVPGRLPAFGEQAEPEQGQGPGRTGAQRPVEARGRLVGDESGGVKAAGNRPFDLFQSGGDLAVGVGLDLPAKTGKAGSPAVRAVAAGIEQNRRRRNHCC